LSAELTFTARADASAYAPRSNGVDLTEPAARVGESRDSDPFLSALIYLARHHGQAISPAAALAGLPTTEVTLGPTLFVRAAARAGLVAAPVKRPLGEIPNLVLPALLWMHDGRALVLLENDPGGDDAVIVDPVRTKSAPERLPRSSLDTGYSGFAFLVTPENRTGGVEQGAARAHWFWSTLALFKASYVHIAIAALLINCLALAFPLFTMNVYDRVLPNGAVASLVALSIGVLIAYAFDFALRIARSRIIDLTGKQADVTLSAQIFAQVLALKLGTRPPSAGVLANQIREFESVREFFTSGTVIAATDLAFAFIFLGVMFVIVGPLAWIPLLLLPITLAIGFLIQRPLDRALKDVQAETAARHGVLVESLVGLETVRALGAESRLQARWERLVASSARSGEAVHHWSSLALTLSNTAQNLASLLIVVWGVFLVLGSQITMGALVAATMLSGRVLSPVANVAAVVMRATRTLHALRAVDRLMRLETERPAGRAFTAREVAQGTVHFDAVSFRYPGSETDALQDVSFSVKGGESIGIIGRIGSGKTTIGRLVDGFYEADRGRVLIDEIDIRQYAPADLRRGIGFVMQDCELFQGSLRDNIVMGRPHASDDEMLAAARLAGVETFAAQSPLGYDLPIAEGGRSLSGGQRQAIALARALIRRPRILFLDEPTSALDLRSEAEFCQRLEQIAAETTLIISTHRLSLLRMVDRLMVFDQGRLVADGPRDEVLLRLRGQPGRVPDAGLQP
jgi:ATP-binding cassette subfamily C protein LapB